MLIAFKPQTWKRGLLLSPARPHICARFTSAAAINYGFPHASGDNHRSVATTVMWNEPVVLGSERSFYKSVFCFLLCSETYSGVDSLPLIQSGKTKKKVCDKTQSIASGPFHSCAEGPQGAPLLSEFLHAAVPKDQKLNLTFFVCVCVCPF